MLRNDEMDVLFDAMLPDLYPFIPFASSYPCSYESYLLVDLSRGHAADPRHGRGHGCDHVHIPDEYCAQGRADVPCSSSRVDTAAGPETLF